MNRSMLTGLRGVWGWILARGLLSIVFGILAFVWPALSLLVLVLLWGTHALADGITALIAGLGLRSEEKPLWPFIMIGALGIVAGLIAVLQPGVAAVALLSVIAFWAIVTGVLQVVAAVRLRREMTNEWLLALSGLLSVAFGVFIVANPIAGTLSIVWVIAMFSIAFGVLLTLLALRLRRLAPTDAPPATASGVAPTGDRT